MKFSKIGTVRALSVSEQVLMMLEFKGAVGRPEYLESFKVELADTKGVDIGASVRFGWEPVDVPHPPPAPEPLAATGYDVSAILADNARLSSLCRLLIGVGLAELMTIVVLACHLLGGR